MLRLVSCAHLRVCACLNLFIKSISTALLLIMYKCAKTETSLDTLDGYEKIETVENTSTSNLRKHVPTAAFSWSRCQQFLSFSIYIYISFLYEICSEVGKKESHTVFEEERSSNKSQACSCSLFKSTTTKKCLVFEKSYALSIEDELSCG